MFKQIFEGYQVNERGEVLSLNYRNTGKSQLMKTAVSPNGYETVILRVNGKSCKQYVHRLVARAFLPDYSEDLQVNHINCNKLDNRVENLEMVTAEENIKHAVDNRLFKHTPVAVINSEGLVYVFHTEKEAAEFLGCSDSNIRHALAGRQSTCKGHEVKYADKETLKKGFDNMNYEHLQEPVEFKESMTIEDHLAFIEMMLVEQKDEVAEIKDKMARVEAKIAKIKEGYYWMEYDDDDYYDMMADQRAKYDKLAKQLLNIMGRIQA